jgi:hypothetical protein
MRVIRLSPDSAIAALDYRTVFACRPNGPASCALWVERRMRVSVIDEERNEPTLDAHEASQAFVSPSKARGLSKQRRIGQARH